MGEGKRNKKRSLYGFKSIALFPDSGKGTKFYQAAKQLHITHLHLSRQLAALEAELGVTLFDRGGHGITLTNEGILLNAVLWNGGSGR